jgi:hypothetical protein
VFFLHPASSFHPQPTPPQPHRGLLFSSADRLLGRFFSNFRRVSFFPASCYDALLRRGIDKRQDVEIRKREVRPFRSTLLYIIVLVVGDWEADSLVLYIANRDARREFSYFTAFSAMLMEHRIVHYKLDRLLTARGSRG